MADLLERLWHEVLARPSGPLAFRFYLQPILAATLAVRDGVRDARRGSSPYAWALVKEPARRKELVRDGWHSIGRVAIVALAIDLVYQLLVLKGLRPVEGLLVALVLAVVPYVLLRGPAGRIARFIRRHRRIEAGA